MISIFYYIIGLIIFVSLIIITRMIYENKKFKVTTYEINTNKIKNEIKIVHLSDLHSNIFGNNNDSLIKKIEKIKPDLILISGDMIVGNDSGDFDVAKNLLKELSKKYKIYYSSGNHEYRIREREEYKKYEIELKKCGIIFLHNEKKDLKINGNNINIFGLETDLIYYEKLKEIEMKIDYLNSLLGESQNDVLNILIAHNPKYFESYAKWGADLTVSGHIHGGMLRIPFLGGVISPQLAIFPKYDKGLFEKNNRFMVISGGLGSHTIKFRLNNQVELVEIILKNNWRN